MVCHQTVSLRRGTILVALLVLVTALRAQNGPEQPPAGPQSPVELERHLDQLTAQLQAMQRRLEESEREMDGLRTELRGLRDQLAERSESDQAAQAVASLRSSVDQLREDTDLIAAQVKTHDQIKVESASKYPVRISGTILFTSLLNAGTVNTIDVPSVAVAPTPNEPSGSLSASVRQTILGLDATGPHLWGGRSSADINVDFFGGIPYSETSTASGVLRLRTAHMGLAWRDRAVTVAMDRPLLTPWQPTSWVTVAEPALSWAGNLWLWAPQLQYSEDGVLPNRKLSLAIGLIDPPAPLATPAISGVRTPGPSERSRLPGEEARVGYELDIHDHPVHLGAGGYYSRQAYANYGHDDAWAGTADWNISLARAVGVSGQFYRGRAIGGLGAGAFKDYVTYNQGTSLRGLDAEGGWGQIKTVFSPVLEMNLAAGQDNAFGYEVRNSDEAVSNSDYTDLARNQEVLGNLVYRPRAYLLLSGEFRRIHSWPISGPSGEDRILGLAVGYSF